PGIPQPVRPCQHTALHAGAECLVVEGPGEASMIYRIVRPILHAGMLLLCLNAALVAAPRHALTLYGEEPKYPANFQHFDYANPDAPKGGTLRQAGFGSFDSLNPFINKGVAADDIGLIY